MRADEPAYSSDCRTGGPRIGCKAEIHRALRVGILGVVGLAAIVSALSCGGEELGSGRDAGADRRSGCGSSRRGGRLQRVMRPAAERRRQSGRPARARPVAPPGARGAGARRGSPASEGSVTEWSIPFADSQPFQIAAWGTSVFYLNAAYEQMLGCLDTEHDTVTEWPLSAPATSPGDIQVRPSDGAVFFTNATVGELGQFDPQSQLLRRWPLPLDVSAGAPPGPWSIAFDASGRVIFSADDAGGPLIGRLDTVSGRLDVWSFQEGGPVRVRLAPDGTVIFAPAVPSPSTSCDLIQ